MDVSRPYRFFKVSLAGKKKKTKTLFLPYGSQNDVKCKWKKRSKEVDLIGNLGDFFIIVL